MALIWNSLKISSGEGGQGGVDIATSSRKFAKAESDIYDTRCNLTDNLHSGGGIIIQKIQASHVRLHAKNTCSN